MTGTAHGDLSPERICARLRTTTCEELTLKDTADGNPSPELCTPSGRRLRGGLRAIVHGPASLPVAGAEVPDGTFAIEGAEFGLCKSCCRGGIGGGTIARPARQWTVGVGRMAGVALEGASGAEPRGKRRRPPTRSKHGMPQGRAEHAFTHKAEAELALSASGTGCRLGRRGRAARPRRADAGPAAGTKRGEAGDGASRRGSGRRLAGRG